MWNFSRIGLLVHHTVTMQELTISILCKRKNRPFWHLWARYLRRLRRLTFDVTSNFVNYQARQPQLTQNLDYPVTSTPKNLKLTPRLVQKINHPGDGCFDLRV